MSTTLFKPCGIGNFEWLNLAASNVGDESRDAAGLFAVGDAERLAEQAEGAAMVLVAPAETISLRQAHFDAAEKKLLRQTLPYSLEDDLAVDVDDLHFALGPIAGDSVDLAIVKRDILEDWQQQCAEQDLDVEAIVPELQLLPLQEGAWTLLLRDQQWLLRCGPSRGFAIEPEQAKLALQMLVDESDALPERLCIYGTELNGSDLHDIEQQAKVIAQLPEMLRGSVDWCGGDYWQVLAQGYAQNPAPINLFQGDYALGLPWKKWLGLWKPALMLFAAVVVVNILMTFIQLKVLEGRNHNLRAETEQVYRSVIPRGAVMDPARQLRSKVSALGSVGGEGFVSVFNRVAKVVGSAKGVELQGINYTEKQTELRLTILADSFNAVETLRANLEKAGLSAELTGSNSDGDKTRARLRVRG